MLKHSHEIFAFARNHWFVHFVVCSVLRFMLLLLFRWCVFGCSSHRKTLLLADWSALRTFNTPIELIIIYCKQQRRPSHARVNSQFVHCYRGDATRAVCCVLCEWMLQIVCLCCLYYERKDAPRSYVRSFVGFVLMDATSGEAAAAAHHQQEQQQTRCCRRRRRDWSCAVE